MLITCPECHNRHDVDPSRIPSEATMVRCRACDHRFALAPQLAAHRSPRPAEVRQPAMAEAQAHTAGSAALALAEPAECEVAVLAAPEPAAASPLPEAGPARARRIGVLISKGGVGKTTTAVNLAHGLALAGKKTLIIDTDTQGQVAYVLGLNNRFGLTEVVTGDKSFEEAVTEARENLWVLPGGKSLAGVKRLIDRKDFAGETTIAEILEPLDARFDFIIVDASPGWDPLTVNVLFYVREVLTPVSLEVMSLQGLREFLKSLAAIKRYNKDIELKYILPTFFDKRVKHPKDILDKLAELYPEAVCQPIRYNVRLSESPAYGQSIFEFAPKSHGASDYRELVRKVAGDPTLLS
jgi:chromosome partitioning protein